MRQPTERERHKKTAQGAILIMQKMEQEISTLKLALRDLLFYWDNQGVSQWTSEDMNRISKIRGMVK